MTPITPQSQKHTTQNPPPKGELYQNLRPHLHHAEPSHRMEMSQRVRGARELPGVNAHPLRQLLGHLHIASD